MCTSVWPYTGASVLLLPSGNRGHYYNVEIHFFPLTDVLVSFKIIGKLQFSASYLNIRQNQ